MLECRVPPSYLIVWLSVALGSNAASAQETTTSTHYAGDDDPDLFIGGVATIPMSDLMAHEASGRPPIRAAVALFVQAQHSRRYQAQQRLYRDSARACLDAASAFPELESPLAQVAGVALQLVGLPAAAAQVFERDVQRIREKAEGGVLAPGLHVPLAFSMFYVAYNRNAALDHEGGLDAYATLIAEPLLSGSDDPRIRTFLADATINRALMLERLHRFRQARVAYRQAASAQDDDEARKLAEYAAWRMMARQRPARSQGRVFLRFARRYAGQAEYATLVASALRRAADAFRDAGLPEQEARAMEALTERVGDDHWLIARRANASSPRATPSILTWNSPELVE